MGPGVTPVRPVGGRGARPLRRRSQDATFNALFDRIVGPDDRVCVPSGSPPAACAPGVSGARRSTRTEDTVPAVAFREGRVGGGDDDDEGSWP